MKKLSIICILVCWSLYCLSQTKIAGFIKDAVNNSKELVLTVYDPLSIYNPQIIEDTIVTKNGYFDFNFRIQKSMNVSIEIAGHSIFFPGTFELVVSPNDSLNIIINDTKKLGILNLEISGRGIEKVDFKKSILREVLAIYKTDPKYKDQNLLFKFLTTDRKLTVIDSIYNSYHGNLDADVKSQIRAGLYESVLESLFISAMRSDNDSLNTYFNHFIIEKDRMKPFCEGQNVFYSGGSLLSEFILLSEYKNPILYIGDQYRIDSINNYSKLITKYFGSTSNVKNYLLSKIMVSYLNSRIFNKSSEEVYDFYVKNTDENNPFLAEVTSTYNRSQQSLQVGKPFFNFSLADTAGKIHSLSEFKGKVLIIDFWFTGCSGCRQMAPALDLLEKKIKDRNIEFISINVDKKETWLKGIGQYSSRGSLQLYTMEQKFHHPIIKSLNILGYPALFVVDRKGNLAGIPPDPRSSEVDFISFIKNM